MKKILVLQLMLLFSFSSTFASDVDNSIIDELEKGVIEESSDNFTLNKFNSCSDLEDVMGDYINNYWKNNYSRNYYGGGLRPEVEFMDDALEESADMAVQSKASNDAGVGGAGEDFSQTNTQVSGVDESDIVKTDGDYIYYFNSGVNYNEDGKYTQPEKFVYILKSGNLDVVKKIKLPKNFYDAQLYIDKNRLVIVSNGYTETDYSKRGYFVNRNQKTYTIVFDTTNKSSPKLLKLYISDGYVSKTRKIDDKLYVLSQNYFNYPYNYFRSDFEGDIDLKASQILPKAVELTKTSDKDKQNLEIKGKKYSYNLKAGSAADCNSIQYVLPDEETIKNGGFNPNYNIISIIDIKDTDNEVETNVIAGNASEIYMSKQNLYLTSYFYKQNRFSCPRGMFCILPYYDAGQNTLIHKLNITDSGLDYQTSSIVPGNPLTQYSMDEHEGYFRILTKKWSPERETGLYILDSDMKLVSKLTGLGKTEDFKSSRYIGDKLYLVTFKQIDPFFVIDLANPKKPEVLGELKIPGYSTYLHPYDENHIIGLGYDTAENKWGGTVNAGVKVDLYEINYDKKCGDANLSQEEVEKCDSGDYKGIIVSQKHNYSLGGYRSSSEALWNPRMFMWNAGKKLLLLPASVYESDEEDIYKTIDFDNGLYFIEIDKDSGINQKASFSNLPNNSVLEADRQEACAPYLKKPDEPKCKKLINGEEYCSETKPGYSYIPTYCYADSSLGEFVSQNYWKYSDNFIKRALWVGDKAYSISNKRVDKIDMNNFTKDLSTEMK